MWKSATFPSCCQILNCLQPNKGSPKPQLISSFTHSRFLPNVWILSLSSTGCCSWPSPESGAHSLQSYFTIVVTVLSAPQCVGTSVAVVVFIDVAFISLSSTFAVLLPLPQPAFGWSCRCCSAWWCCIGLLLPLFCTSLIYKHKLSFFILLFDSSNSNPYKWVLFYGFINKFSFNFESDCWIAKSVMLSIFHT